jgi:hypothetical protein
LSANLNLLLPQRNLFLLFLTFFYECFLGANV